MPHHRHQLARRRLAYIQSLVLARHPRQPLPRLIPRITNPPDPPLLAVHARRIRLRILIARILVAPVHHPQNPVWPRLDAHRPEPPVVRPQKIPNRPRLEPRTRRLQRFLVNRIVMDVPEKRMPRRVPGIHPALINLNPRIRSPEMLRLIRLHNARQQLIRIRILRRPALPRIDPTRSHVKQVINHARLHKRIALSIEIHSPRIARPVRVHFVKRHHRIRRRITRRRQLHPVNPRIQHVPRIILLPRPPHFAVREHPVREIHHPVRPPHETVQQLMPVLQPEPRQHRLVLVSLVVPVRIPEEKQVRSLPHIHPAVPAQHRRRQTQSLRKHRPLVRLPVIVRVLQNHHPVPRRTRTHLHHRPVLPVARRLLILVRLLRSARVLV